MPLYCSHVCYVLAKLVEHPSGNQGTNKHRLNDDGRCQRLFVCFVLKGAKRTTTRLSGPSLCGTGPAEIFAAGLFLGGRTWGTTHFVPSNPKTSQWSRVILAQMRESILWRDKNQFSHPQLNWYANLLSTAAWSNRMLA